MNHKIAKCIGCLSISFVMFGCLTAARAQDLGRFFKQTAGAFVLYDLKNDRYLRYNEARCRERFSPFSTFKIPNSLIALETKAIEGADSLIRWEPEKFPGSSGWTTPPAVHWKQDHTLRSAIKHSVVWYYREIARRVGEERMKKYVENFHYGNHDISGGISSPGLYDCFWINSSLRISADEQIDFLKNFFLGKLPVSERSRQIVREILILEKTPEYTLSAKTGAGPVSDGKVLGWFVGYVETKGNVYFFATNIEGPTAASIRDKRIALTKEILKHLGYLPQ